MFTSAILALFGAIIFYTMSSCKCVIVNVSLNAQDGSFVWSFATGSDVASSPAVANGILVVGSYDGKVYALDSTTGDCLWSYATGDMVVSSPAIAGGNVYVGSYDHLVYAFGTASSSKEADMLLTTYSLAITITILMFILAIGLVSILFYRRRSGN